MVYYHEPLAKVANDQGPAATYKYWNTFYGRSWNSLPEAMEASEQSVDELFDSPQYAFNVLPLWTVHDGLYEGRSWLDNSAYAEIIDYAGGDRNAVRIWSSNESHGICRALDQQPLIPTGQPGVAGTPLNILSENLVVSLADTQSEQTPTTNLETGQPVTYSDAVYNYNRDIAGQSIYCEDKGFGWEVQGQYDVTFFDLSIYATRYIFHPYNGGDHLWITYRHPGADYPGYGWVAKKFPFSDGTLSIFSSNFELTESGFRDWKTDSFVTQCYTDFKPLEPQQDVDESVDGETSPPESTDNTDNNNGVDNTTEEAPDVDTNNSSNSEGATAELQSSEQSGGGAFDIIMLLLFGWLITTVQQRPTLPGRSCTSK